MRLILYLLKTGLFTKQLRKGVLSLSGLTFKRNSIGVV